MIIAISAGMGEGKDTFCELFKKNSQLTWENKKFAGKLKQIVALITGCNVEDLESEEFKNTYLPEIWNKKVLNIPKYLDCELSEEGKEVYTTIKRFTYRELLQVFGTELMRDGFHDQVHINALFADYKVVNQWPEYGTITNDNGVVEGRVPIGMNTVWPNWLITDLRFQNEFDAVKVNGGITVRVVRSMAPEEWIASKYFNQINFTKTGLEVLQIPTWKKISKMEMVEFLTINKSLMVDADNDKNYLKLIHQSDTDLNNHYKQGKFDFVINNTSTLEDFEKQIVELVKSF